MIFSDPIIDKMDALALVEVDINMPSKIESVMTSVLSAAEKLVPKNLLTPQIFLVSESNRPLLDIFEAYAHSSSARPGGD